MDESLNGPLSNFNEVSSTNRDIQQLKDIDNLLRCGICYEYFDTCVVTDCSHNFCSLCIRKYIQYKTECPVCFHQLYDSQLRANRIIDNLIGIFPELKDRIIHHLRTLKTLKPNCIYVSPSKTTNHTTPQKRHSSAERIFKTPVNHEDNSAVAGPSQSVDRITNSNKVIIPKMFQSPVKKSSPAIDHTTNKFVSCPVCQVEIPERNINLHLDDCLNRDKAERRKEQQTCSGRKHLPKLVYRLMSVSVLRSKLKEHGLNSQGDFEMLKNRLQRYTALYNAECDKPNPRPVQEIIRQLEKEEKALSSQKLPKSIFAVSRDDNLSKEELKEQYLKENRDSFQTLITNVKKRKKTMDEKEDMNLKHSEEEPEMTKDICKPSTSNSNFHSNFIDCGSNLNDWIDIEENNVEEIKVEPAGEVGIENVEEEMKDKCEMKKENIAEDVGGGHNSEDLCVSILQKHCRRSKRNLFKEATSHEETESDDSVSLLNGRDEENFIEMNENSEISEEENENVIVGDKITSNEPTVDPLMLEQIYCTVEVSRRQEKVRDKKTSCIYCGKDVNHFCRHLQRKHSLEEEVVKFMELEKGCKERKRLIDVIRRRGNFVKRENGVIRPVRRLRFQDYENSMRDYVACVLCKGFYVKRYMHRHLKNCPLKDNDHSDAIPADTNSLKSNNLLKKYLTIENKIKTVIMNDMKTDDITFTVVNDDLIVAMAEAMLRKKNFRQLSSTSFNNLRNLAKLLLQVKKLSDCETLIDSLKPEYYNVLLRAAKMEAGYDEKNEKYASQSYALNFRRTLITICELASHLITLKHPKIMANDVSAQKKQLKMIKELIESRWKPDISNPRTRDFCDEENHSSYQTRVPSKESPHL